MVRFTKTAAALVGMAAALSGCAQLRACLFPAKAQPQQAAVPAQEPVRIELVPFQLGVSSVTVENLAKERGCTGGKGAGLITERGPVEVYRMQCDNGKTFLARCEMRQCKPM